MDFSYKFYAVEGIQAGKNYYIAMIPLKIISKILSTDTDDVLPEYRAQRRINELRIPEIKEYILKNRENYVFSALSASIDGDFTFAVISGKVGILEIDMGATLLINDGQHRKAAIEQALEEDPTLGDETISVVFFEDDGLKKSQQMFTDLNKHAVKTSNSLATLYDSRDNLAVFTKNMINEIEFLKKYTDKERDILGKNSSKLFTLNTIYKANQKIFLSKNLEEKDYDFLVKYWKNVVSNINEWNDLVNKDITKKDLRENYVVTLSIVIIALGKLGRFFYDNQNLNLEICLKNLQNIDWSRSNEQWKGNIIRDNGKVNNSEKTINLTSSLIKKIIMPNDYKELKL